MFVDGDDYLNITCIEECLKYSNGMDIVWFHQGFVEFRLQYKKRMTITPIQWIDRLKEKNINYFWFGHGGLIDFSFLISSNIRFIEEYMHEDHAFGIQLFSSAKNIFVLPAHLYYYVPSQNSVTRPSAISGNVHIYPHIEYLTKYFNHSKDIRGYHSEISAIAINSAILKHIDELKDEELKDKLFNTFTFYSDNTIERCLRTKEDPLNFYKQAILSNKTYNIKPTLFNDISKENLFLICRYAFIKKINELTSEMMGYKNKTIFLEQKIINQNKNLIAELIYCKEQNSILEQKLAPKAKSRIHNQLSYKLGQAMIANSKSIWGYIRMPYVLSYIKDMHKKEQIAYNEKIKANPSLKLPPLESYPDYKEALKEKECLTYKLGEAMIEASKNWYKGGYIKLWFKCKNIQKECKNR
ncbi:hypothetical protein [Campylobacter vicugnae]|uniref:hypothetical protein n=1 Tax=Campylobacter vicugnae TaxID=1660076 RepID=UPI001F42A412|nr:hypothetical protein [Campylobacter sp. S0112]